MNMKEARKLAVGDRVSTDQLPPGEHHTGTVTVIDSFAATILWDDGQEGAVDYGGVAKIDKLDTTRGWEGLRP